MRAIRIFGYGGPEVLEVVEADTPTPGPGQILVRTAAIGLNFLDIYQRTGLYRHQPLPAQLGAEAAGVVEAIGDGVTRFKAGDRAVFGPILGAYADYVVVDADRAVPIPQGVTTEVAAAALTKGMTAEFLLNRAYSVKARETILIHAAAGGVGAIMVQWAKALGAIVIGTVGSAAKADFAKALGADHVINYASEDVAAEVRRITDGAGVRVVYDSVGVDTFEGSLASLGRRGMLIVYGVASGPVPMFDTIRLARMGSLYIHRVTLQDYVSTVDELDASAGALFGLISQGKIDVSIGQRFAMTDVRAAHQAMESRATMGSSLLIP